MARLPYPDLNRCSAEVRDLFERLRRTRPRTPHLHWLLAHNTGAVTALAAVGQVVVVDGVIADRALQELVTLRTAMLTGDDVEWGRHAVAARRAGVPDGLLSELHRWQAAPGFTDVQRAALAVADAMAFDGEAAPGQVAELRRLAGDPVTVGVVTVAGVYQMVGRINRTLGVDPLPGDEPIPRRLRPPAVTGDHRPDPAADIQTTDGAGNARRPPSDRTVKVTCDASTRSNRARPSGEPRRGDGRPTSGR